MNYQNVIHKQRDFENNLNVSHRKDFGIFHTNNVNTIDKILGVIDFKDPNILRKKFLEPSCGNGVFIIRLLEKLFEEQININDAINFIESSIFFVDIDEKMIEQTKVNISKYFFHKFGSEFTGNFNAYIFDYTQRIKPKYNNTLFDDLLDVPLKNLINGVDYIIGNPPYVSLYGRRDRKKDEAQRIYYLTRYSQFPDTLKNGKLNYVMLFIEQSIDLLKEGGKLCFIIDLAFFETAYEHTRKYLLENTKVLAIEYNIKDFNVTSGQVILTVQKEKAKSNCVKIIDAETNNITIIDQIKWKNPSDQYKFRFNSCSLNQVIINRINAFNFPSLKDLYPKKNLRTCVMLLDMENLFVFNEHKDELGVKIYPYYQGSKGLSEKYGKPNYTKYFHYNKALQDKINDELKEELTLKGIKNKKRLGLGETIIYDNPKVYIRQSAKEIIATYDNKPSSANNSLYVFSLRQNDNNAVIFLKFLCGYLNSDLITYYSQQMNIIRYSKGKQPQIKTSDLYSIPIPTNQHLRTEIVNLVDEIYSDQNKENCINAINELIYQTFGITNDEIKRIKESIVSF